MKDAWMAIRLSLKYKWSIIGSILSSIMIAFLFGASITTVLPFVKVVFSEKTNTLEKWVNHEITVNDQRKVEAERALASLPADQVFQRETEQKKLDGAIMMATIIVGSNGIFVDAFLRPRSVRFSWSLFGCSSPACSKGCS